MPELRAEDYLGLTTTEAEELARAEGWVVRSVGPDDMVTMDFRDDRITLVSTYGLVTAVSAG